MCPGTSLGLPGSRRCPAPGRSASCRAVPRCPGRATLCRARSLLNGDSPDQSTGTSDSPPAPVQFLSGPPGGEGTGSGSGWGGGTYSGLPNNLGPFNGGGGAGGSGGGGPLFFSDPGDPSAPAPTPEPATILLIGSNVVLLGAASWRRFRSTKET